MRAIFEALGADVDWNPDEKKITATKDNFDVILNINDKNMLVNGIATTLDVPATIIDGRTFVPVRAISEALDCDVEWRGESKTVVINTKAETDTEATTEIGTETTTEAITETTTEEVSYETTQPAWINTLLTYSEKPETIPNIAKLKPIMALRSFVFSDFESNLQNDFDSKTLTKLAGYIDGKRKDKVEQFVKIRWIQYMVDHVYEYEMYCKSNGKVVEKSKDSYSSSVAYFQRYQNDTENSYSVTYNLVELIFANDGDTYKRDIPEINKFIKGLSDTANLDFDTNISYYYTKTDEGKYALLLSETDTDEITENHCSYMLIIFDKDGNADYFKLVSDGNKNYSLNKNGEVVKTDMENDLQTFLGEVENLITG
jgi:hypothetical protein